MSLGTVAVIDDDQSVGKAVRRLLSSVGFRALVYGSAAEFLSAADGESPACILADLNMPGMTGLELQQALREAGWCVPLILMTGHEGEKRETSEALDGAAALLRKPFTETELLEAVDRATQERSL